MINARQFSTLFQSFWRPFAPGLRELSKVMHEQTYHYGTPVMQQHAPSKRGLSSELGFRAFCLKFRNSQNCMSAEDAINLSEVSVAAYISRLRRAEGDPEFLIADVASIDDAVRMDAIVQCQQLDAFCASLHKSAKIVLEPIIPGCGIVDKCTGDILIDGDLYESKSRIGDFEQSDLRQLITYSMLSFISNPDHVTRMGILNPFKATRSLLLVSEAIYLISRLSVLEFSLLIADVLSAELSSR